ncbi:MAG: flavin reductase domain protein FMN-binding protein [Enterovirga sp.]|jgi:flavin reductase|nr:flavin reductase domain protein FMN-binding protein [Enterovirga sp.]
MIDSALFKRGMRRLAAGVSLVTTIDGDEPHGLLATSVSSVSADPVPSLLVCVNRSASAHDRIQKASVFCVNLLGEDEMHLAERFMSADKASRFAGSCWTVLETGAPAVEGALASFDCEVLKAVEVGSHTLFIGAVKVARLWDEEISPLLYLDGRFEVLRSAAAA